MVGEFPELQGLMGRYYAEHDGEPPEVSAAIEQHYWPRFAGDALPEGPVAQSVALADKLDTLVGIWGIGLIPTGDKDPFGLRRHALGVLRILLERRLPLSLADLIKWAAEEFPSGTLAPDTATGVYGFVLDRLRQLLREAGASERSRGRAGRRTGTHRPGSVAPGRRPDLCRAAGSRRAGGRQQAHRQHPAQERRRGRAAVDRGRLGRRRRARPLHGVPEARAAGGSRLRQAGTSAAALRALATAKPVVDRYFDDVMVMADDPAIRANRLALLRSVAATMNRVADISKLAQ